MQSSVQRILLEFLVGINADSALPARLLLLLRMVSQSAAGPRHSRTFAVHVKLVSIVQRNSTQTSVSTVQLDGTQQLDKVNARRAVTIGL